jgi:hypothetical protein
MLGQRASSHGLIAKENLIRGRFQGRLIVATILRGPRRIDGVRAVNDDFLAGSGGEGDGLVRRPGPGQSNGLAITPAPNHAGLAGRQDIGGALNRAKGRALRAVIAVVAPGCDVYRIGRGVDSMRHDQEEGTDQ